MKWLTDLLKKMDKTKWLILGLSGILLLVIALPADSISQTKEDDALAKSLRLKEGNLQDNQVKEYENRLTKQLEQILSRMEGAGDVRVMITFQNSGESVVEKDVTKSEREGNQIQYQESSVYQETGSREPYISQQKLPSVEGIFIVAQGGGDSMVKQNLKDAVMALFSIEAHKIKIVKMQNHEDAKS